MMAINVAEACKLWYICDKCCIETWFVGFIWL